MSDATVGDVAKKVTGWSIAISVLMIIAGLLAILMPLEAGIAVNVFVGWMLIFAAVAHFVHGRRDLESAGGNFVWSDRILSAGTSGARAGDADAYARLLPAD
jgi:uncharacterized membrane protein HdeD (DUF308 family)